MRHGRKDIDMTTQMGGTSSPVGGTSSSMSTRTGWSIFGGLVLGLLGAVNLVQGITALQYDELLANSYVYDNLTFWGWAFLVWGALQLVAGVMTLAGSESGPAAGMVLAAIGAMGWFFMIFAAPEAAIVGIGLSVAVMASLATAVRT